MRNTPELLHRHKHLCRSSKLERLRPRQRQRITISGFPKIRMALYIRLHFRRVHLSRVEQDNKITTWIPSLIDQESGRDNSEQCETKARKSQRNRFCNCKDVPSKAHSNDSKVDRLDVTHRNETKWYQQDTITGRRFQEREIIRRFQMGRKDSRACAARIHFLMLVFSYNEWIAIGYPPHPTFYHLSLCVPAEDQRDTSTSRNPHNWQAESSRTAAGVSQMLRS